MEKISNGRLENILGEHPMTIFEYKTYESVIRDNYSEAKKLAGRIKKSICIISPEVVERHEEMKEKYPFIKGLDYEKLCYTFIHIGMVDIVSGGYSVGMELLSKKRRRRRYFPIIGNLINKIMLEKDAEETQKQACHITSIYWCDEDSDEKMELFKKNARVNYGLDADTVKPELKCGPTGVLTG